MNSKFANRHCFSSFYDIYYYGKYIGTTTKELRMIYIENYFAIHNLSKKNNDFIEYVEKMAPDCGT